MKGQITLYPTGDGYDIVQNDMDCPVCQKRTHTNMWISVEYADSFANEFKCDDCGAKFHILAIVSPPTIIEAEWETVNA